MNLYSFLTVAMFLLTGVALYIWGGSAGAEAGGAILGSASALVLAIFGVSKLVQSAKK